MTPCKQPQEISNLLVKLKMQMFINNNIVYRKNVKDIPLVKPTYIHLYEGQLNANKLNQ